MKKILILMICVIALTVQTAFATNIEVGLMEKQYSAEINASAPMQINDGTGVKTLPKGRYFINVSDGKISIDDMTINAGARLTVSQGNGIIEVNKQKYSDTIKVYVIDNNLTITNILDLEKYVNAVLGPKSSPIWPEEAIKAQAVAVRSFAYYKMLNPEGVFAIRNTEDTMYFGGPTNENRAINKIAALTKGRVLKYGDAPVLAYTQDTSGGQTEDSNNILGRVYPYLKSVKDYDKDSPNFNWERTIAVNDVERILTQSQYDVGKLEVITLSPLEEPYGNDRTATGRIRNITVKGDKNTYTINGKEFAKIFSLNSTLFDIYPENMVPQFLDVNIENSYGMVIGRKRITIAVQEDDKPRWKSFFDGQFFLSGVKNEKIVFKGSGLGNGLGLSKWGARGMAKDERASYVVILQHYFPGCSVVQL